MKYTEFYISCVTDMFSVTDMFGATDLLAMIDLIPGDTTVQVI